VELALKRDLRKPLTKTERRRMSERLATRQSDLIEEVSEGGACFAAARNILGEPVYRNDPVWALLKTVERAPYCCSFADMGRLMKISRQHARRLGFVAAQRGLVELALNDHDRRIVQILLTKAGRGELSRVRQQRRIWAARLLLGLDTPRLLMATHVVRVIRQRLEQAERDGQAAIATTVGAEPRAPS
jgi:DNA-binding MarR family transcriptional regulator